MDDLPPGYKRVGPDPEYPPGTSTGEQFVQENLRLYKEEAELSFGILKVNRHRSIEPYEWFGPDAEPCPPGKDCKCLGCDARFVF